MSGPPLNPGTTGGCKYAVATDDRTDLRVTLWVRRAPEICVVLQPLDNFKGTEHLGSFGGHGGSLPKCNPHDYTDVMRVSAGVLNGLSGGVIVDLVEPGVALNPLHRELHEVIEERTYMDFSPWVVVAVVVPRAA